MLGRKNNQKSGNRRFSFFYGKIVVHPLFLLFGLWHAATGELLLFFSLVVCAIAHEFAHAAEAAKHGFASKTILLMPYGATIDIDLNGVHPKDEIRVSLAGPLCNFGIAVFFLALWWCFPSTYPYTEIAFYATLSLALCNLLPAYPLDGGRVLYCALNLLFNAYLPPTKSQKYAKNITKTLSVTLCGIGLFIFAISAIRHTPNFSLLFFVLFVAVGLFEKSKPTYCKIDFSNRRAFERGIPVKRVAVSSACTVKKAISFLSSGDYLILDVYADNEAYVGSMTQSQLSDFFTLSSIDTQLGEYFLQETPPA